MTSWYSFSLFLHLVGMALWLGGMAFFLVVFGPAVHELQPGIGIRTLDQGRISFEAVSWTGIAILLLTGIVNLILQREAVSAPQGSFYTTVLAVKLFCFAAMLFHHCLQVFKYAPKITALTAQLTRGADSWPEPLLTYWRRWFLLLKVNAALGPLVTLLGLVLVK